MRYFIKRYGKKWQTALQTDESGEWEDEKSCGVFDTRQEALEYAETVNGYPITTDIDPLEDQEQYENMLLTEGKTQEEADKIINQFRKQYGA